MDERYKIRFRASISPARRIRTARLDLGFVAAIRRSGCEETTELRRVESQARQVLMELDAG